MAANSLQKQPGQVAGCRANDECAQCAWHSRRRERGYATQTRNSPDSDLLYQVDGIEPFN
jgi:hypothetical protein